MISKNQIRYIKSLHSKKNRDKEKTFLAEGVKIIDEIIHNKASIVKQLFCTDYFYDKFKSVIEKNSISTLLISQEDLKKISTLTTPNEALALCSYFPLLKPKKLEKGRLYFFLDKISDPGNLGTIIRLCSWFGVDSLFCSPGTADCYNPKCIQASMASFFKVNVFYIDLSDLINNNEHIPLYAADLKGDNIYDSNIREGIVVIGNEAHGISLDTKKLCNKTVTIPSVTANTESLNAAMAASIIASEWYRNTR